MSRSQGSGPKLPRTLLDQFGSGQAGKSVRSQSRTQRRKLERQQKKTAKLPTKRRHQTQSTKQNDRDGSRDTVARPTSKPAQRFTTVEVDDDSSKGSDPEDDDVDDEPLMSERPSRTARHRLEHDDAEIAALEKKLGIKRGRKAIGDEALDDLLGDIGAGSDTELTVGKRKSREDDDWLQQKRRKIQSQESDFEGFSESEAASSDASPRSMEDGFAEDLASEDEEKFAYHEDDWSADSDSNGIDNPGPSQQYVAKSSRRENPYVAPRPVQASGEKYVPPSLRQLSSSDDAGTVRLQRQIQGLINRLSESNMLSILQSVESLYQDNPRQYVTNGLINTLLALLADPSPLSDTFILLHGGFVAALYRSVGIDFGAQFLERTVKELDSAESSENKRSANLVSLLSTMYNLQVISCNIIYDLIRQYVEKFNEDNTELLLRIVRTCGSQLRSDDPSALKDVVALVQKTAGANGHEVLSVRQSFMIETMNDLKNNKLKAGMASSAGRSEAMTRMKKLLGTVKSKSSRASEPLRVTIADIRDSDRKGKWWLIGASYNDPFKAANQDDGEQGQRPTVPETTIAQQATQSETTSDLARNLGMNTDIRRAIFDAITLAVDYKHALILLNKLTLKKAQKEEISNVLIRCATAEAAYNPYYALIARNLCTTDRRVKMAFQFALWDQLGRMAGSNDDDDASEDVGDELDVRKIVSLAKLYATLIRSDAVPVTALKKVDFLDLPTQTRMFLEVLLTTVILDKSDVSGFGAGSAEDVLLGMRDVPDMVVAFRYFLQTVLATSQVPVKKRHREKVADVCGRVSHKLSGATPVDVEE